MKTNRIKGKWNIIKGKLKQKCARISHDDSRYAEGREDELIGRLQQSLGKSRDELKGMLNVRPASNRQEDKGAKKFGRP